MDIIRFILAVCAAMFMGFSLMRLLAGDIRKVLYSWEQAAISLVLGFGCITVEMLAFSVMGISPDILMILLPWPVVFITGMYLDRKRGTDNVLRGKVFPAGVFFKVIAGIMSLQVASIFLRAMSKPLEAYDAIINFGIKAKIMFFSGILPDPAIFEGIGKGHMDYPLLLPLSETWIFLFLGEHNDLMVKALFPIMFVAFLVMFYFSLTRMVGQRRAAVFTLLLGTVPQIVNFATIGYADLSFTMMVTVSYLCIVQYFIERQKGFLLIAALFSGMGLLTKNEGISFFAASIFVILLHSLGSKDMKGVIRSAILFYVLPVILMLLPWHLFKAELGVTNTDISIAGLTASKLMENARQIPFILNKFQQEVFGPKKWNILWVMVLAFSVIRFSRIKGSVARNTAVFLAANCAVYFLSYMMLTGKDLYFHVNTTMSRLMMHFAGVSLFYLLWLIKDDLKKLEIFKDD